VQQPSFTSAAQQALAGSQQASFAEQQSLALSPVRPKLAAAMANRESECVIALVNMEESPVEFIE
jgi:hypothetical protein